MNGYALVARCDDANSTLFALGPYAGPARIAYGDPSLAAYDPADRKTLSYDIYVPESGRYTSAADFNAKMPTYDLTKEPIELCIRLGAGAMTGVKARSNEARAIVGTR
jgi:hypothetical protein